MSEAYRLAMDDELHTFRSVAPPPYSGLAPTPPAAMAIDATREAYDLTPLPQSQNRPRLPEEKRNQYLGECMFLLFFQVK